MKCRTWAFKNLVEEGCIDRLNKCEQVAKKEAGKYIDLDKVELRQCSRPSKQAVEIYDMLGMKHAPFKKMKICRTQHPPDKQPLPCCRGKCAKWGVKVGVISGRIEIPFGSTQCGMCAVH